MIAEQYDSWYVPTITAFRSQNNNFMIEVKSSIICLFYNDISVLPVLLPWEKLFSFMTNQATVYKQI